MWGLPVTQGETLYLCLEDSERRIQERLNTVTDDVPPGLYFATGNTSIEGGVCDWIRNFKQAHPGITFVAIDTFQLIRTPTPDVSYGNDYAELQPLRALAEELKLPYAVDIYPGYSSDTAAALRAGLDARFALCGQGVFASHGYERTHVKGLMATLALVSAFAQKQK